MPETVKIQMSELRDTCLVQLQLVEGKEPGKVLVRGEFARAGNATENKRVYPRPLWEREIRRLDEARTDRRLFGELDHPSDGRTQLSRVSHIITNMTVDEKGLVVGEAEVLDTARGKDLKALLQSGCKVGVSSRGYGSTKPNDKGEDVVQEDYRLVTFDFVAEPADSTAYPKVFFEGKEIPMADTQESAPQPPVVDEAVKLVQVREEALEQARAELKEQFSAQLLEKVAAMKAEAIEQVRGELLTDPAVAGAKTALDRIKDLVRPYVLPEETEGLVAQKDAEVQRLKIQLAERDLHLKSKDEEIGKLAAVAKEAGYRFFLERCVACDPDAELIRKLVGNVTEYETSAALKAKVEAVRVELKKKQDEGKRRQAEVEQARVRSQAHESQMKGQVNQLTESLEQSLQANEALAVLLYAERKLTNHPKAAKIRQMIEASNPTTKDQVDEIVRSFREPERDSEQVESVRSRVRNLTRGGLGSTPHEEETPVQRHAIVEENFNGLGVPLGELRALSGVVNSKLGSKASG